MLSIRQPCEFVFEFFRLLSSQNLRLPNALRDLPGDHLDDSTMILGEGITMRRVDCKHAHQIRVRQEWRAQTTSKWWSECSGDLTQVEHRIGIDDCLPIGRNPPREPLSHLYLYVGEMGRVIARRVRRHEFVS